MNSGLLGESPLLMLPAFHPPSPNKDLVALFSNSPDCLLCCYIITSATRGRHLTTNTNSGHEKLFSQWASMVVSDEDGLLSTCLESYFCSPRTRSLRYQLRLVRYVLRLLAVGLTEQLKCFLYVVQKLAGANCPDASRLFSLILSSILKLQLFTFQATHFLYPYLNYVSSVLRAT